MPTSQTQQRILDCSLVLFNASGAPNVTTNQIADELGISPGNLYYHVRNKDDIVGQLFERFEQRMDEALATPGQRAADLEDLWLQLHLVFECIGAYRFLYRDLVGILGRDPRLRRRFARMLVRAGTAARQMLGGLATTGALRASGDELDAVATNLVVLSTFWLNYAAVCGERDEQASIGAGIAQVMMLLAPFLRAEERAHLDTLTRAYRH